MIARELLDKVMAFKGLDSDLLKLVQACCVELELQKGAKLFEEGEDATHLWFVLEGMVDLRFKLPGQTASSDESTVRSITVEGNDLAAKTLGWSCFVPPHKLRLSAYCASTYCKMVRVNKDDLNALFEKEPKLGYHFMSYMVTVVGGRFQRFQEEVIRTMGERVMSGW